jgi:inorganic pyrophosphatase
MTLNSISAGRNVPDDCNVIIEIPMLADPIKYEVDKATGALFVDRFMSTAMHYPCNYGYMPQTLCGDGDPIDVLVLAPFPLMSGTIVRCRPVAVLRMEDENGEDAKVLAVPVAAVSRLYDDVQSLPDISPVQLNHIEHFFQHYKDLEPGKFVRTLGWEGADAARAEILRSVEDYNRGG